MSHRFPIYRVRSGYVVPVDDTNDNFQAYAEELAGKLNEHNFAVNAFNDRSQYDLAAAFRLWRERVVIQPEDTRDPETPGHPWPTGTFTIPASGTWAAVPGVSLDIQDSPGGRLWVIAQWTHQNWAGVLSTGGAMYAIRLNGQVVAESIIGSGEPSNDPYFEDVSDIHYTTPGVVGARVTCRTGIVVDIPPGNHAVDLVVRAIGDSYTKTNRQLVNQREVFALEMFR